MIVYPRDWFAYGDQIYLFAHSEEEEDKVFQLEPFECYYKQSKNKISWNLFASRPSFGWKFDRTNKLLSIFKYANIQPYQPLLLKNVIEGDMNHVAAHQIQPAQIATKYSPIGIRMYFDIECLSTTGNFTIPDDDNASIAMISMIFADKDTYISHLITIRNGSYEGVRIHLVKDEKELLEKFYEIWLYYSPTEVIHYNGYNFDVPWILHRTKKHKIHVEDLGFLDYGSTEIKTRRINFGVRSKPQKEITWFIPGVKNIDFVSFFRRFYPELPSYHLDYIAYRFLGRGKTGLPIEKMFRILASGTQEEMSEVIHYSYIDTLLLYELDKELNIMNRIVETSNHLRVTAENLMMMSDAKLCKSISYNLNNSVLVNPIQLNSIPFLFSMKPGTYHNLHFYDYTSIILDSFQDSCIKEILQLAPRGIALKFLFSNQCDDESRNKFLANFEIFYPPKQDIGIYFDEPVYEEPSKTLSITEYGIYSLDDLQLPELQRDEIRAALDNTNYSICNGEEINHYGKSLAFHHPFKLIKEYHDEYCKNIKKNQYISLFPTIFEREIPLLQIAIKIRPSHTYSNHDDLGYRIAVDIEKNKLITSWMTAKYYRVVPSMENNFSIYSLLENPDPKSIDTTWYRNEMMRVTYAMMSMFKNIR